MDTIEQLRCRWSNSKKYNIIGGVNGVGKSTFIGANEEDPSYFGTIINVDEITKEFAEGNEINGAKLAINKINSSIKEGLTFTQESTLSGRHVIRTIEKAKKAGYYIHLYYIALDSEKQSVIRVNNRVLLGGHDIPTDVIAKRFQKRFQDLYKVAVHADSVSLYDNTRGFKRVAVFSYGSIIKQVKENEEPVWLKEFQNFISKNSII